MGNLISLTPVVHEWGSVSAGTTACCGYLVTSLPSRDRMTFNWRAVTCPRRP